MDTPTAAAPLTATVVEACRARALVEPGARVLVAASGGADSTALALLLHDAGRFGLPLELVLGHVDHGWRGPEAARADADAVRALGRRLGAPVRVSPPPPDVRRTEDAARRWRYRALGALARADACRVVAVAHHAGDQAETFLMRLLRGSGPIGLAGIPWRRPLRPGGLRVIRPLLEVEPGALRALLEESGVAWREDPTNADLSRDRSAVRARLAEQRGTPALAALAQRLGRRLASRERRIAHAARERVRHHALAQATEMPRAWLASLHGEDLALALRHAGSLLEAEVDGPWFTRRHVARIASLLERGGDLDLPRGLVFHVGGKRAWLARRMLPADPALPRLQREDVPRGAFDLEGFLARARPGEAALDAARLGGRARLRLLDPDDRFTPYGRAGRRPVAVAAWLSRRGVPALGRRGQPVLEGRSGIAWVVGHRVDAEHAVGPTTGTVAVVRVGTAGREGAGGAER